MLKYDGIGQVAMTALTEATDNTPIMAAGPDFWMPSEDGTEFGGVCIHAKDMLATVAISGVVTLPYSGDAPGYGLIGLVSDGNGGVKVGESVRPRVIVKVNEETKKVTFIL